MTIAFTRWPDALAQRYRERGYWLGLALTDILQRQADRDVAAISDSISTLSYRQLDDKSDRLAAALQRRGLGAAIPRWYSWVTSPNFTWCFLRC
jgi:2,3-dihydroxybenzoate-AMP ligase